MHSAAKRVAKHPTGQAEGTVQCLLPLEGKYCSGFPGPAGGLTRSCRNLLMQNEMAALGLQRSQELAAEFQDLLWHKPRRTPQNPESPANPRMNGALADLGCMVQP